MGNESVRRPRGTRDFGPREMFARRQVESILREVAGSFGYGEIATPTFEHLDLFTGKSGEEIVDQLYTFEDKGGRSLCLRPELTAAAIRFFSEEMAYLPKPVKIFYHGNCFRYERPQKGRYREFWQFGAECIGTDTPQAFAEIIALAYEGVRRTGLRKCVLRIGHLGILKGLLEKLNANGKAVMTLIDKGNTEGISDYFYDKGLNDVQLLLDMLALMEDPDALVEGRKLLLQEPDAGKETGELAGRVPGTASEIGIGQHGDVEDDSPTPEWELMVRSGFDSLAMVSRILDESGIAHIIDFGIARGLDYYTGIVFEIDVPSLGAEKQICGGGEYNLNELFSMNVKGTSGFAIGFDRLLLALENDAVEFTIPAPLVGIVPMSGCEVTAFTLASGLRRAGVGTELEVAGKGLKKSLKRMNELGVRFTVIIGERELEKGNVILRDMTSGEQEEIALQDVQNRIGGP